MSGIKNISYLWIGTISGAGFVFLSQIIFARHLTPFDYGILSSSLVAVTMLGPIAGFGVSNFWLKAFGTEGWQAKRWIIPSIRFLCISSLLAGTSLFIYSRMSVMEREAELVLWMVPLIFAFVVVELVTARLQLEERFAVLSVWQILPQFGRLMIALLLVVCAGGLFAVGVGFFFLAIMVIIIGTPMVFGTLKDNFRLAGHDGIRIQPELPIPKEGDVFLSAWPFAIAGVFFLVYFQSDILLLKWMRGAETAGQYNVAYTVMVAVYLLPSVVYQKYLLPKQHRWAEHERQRFLAVYRLGCGVMLTTGLIVMVTLLLSALWVVPLVFGKSYSQAGYILLILAICAPLRFLATSVGGTLVTQDNMRYKVWYMGLAALVNIALNILLIPAYSYYGAAAATVVSEILILGMYLVAVKQRVFGADAWRGWTLRYGPFPK